MRLYLGLYISNLIAHRKSYLKPIFAALNLFYEI